MSQTKFWCIKG